MMVKPERRRRSAADVPIGQVSALLHVQPCPIAALFSVQREVDIAGKAQAFAAARIAVLILLGRDEAPKAVFPAGIRKPLRHVPQMIFLGLVARLAADELPIVQDDTLYAVRHDGAAYHVAHLIERSTRRTFVQRSVGYPTRILRNAPCEFFGRFL